MNRPSLLVSAVALAVLAVVSTALPVAAAGSWQKRVGDYAYWLPWDQPGVVCRYKGEAQTLRTMRVRPPQAVHGRYADAQWVGWQFKVVNVPDGPTDTDFSSWTAVYKSAIFKDEASNTVSADFNGTWRTWYAPASLAAGRYAIFYRIFWYEPGTKKVVEGWIQDRYEKYRSKLGTETFYSWYSCDDVY